MMTFLMIIHVEWFLWQPIAVPVLIVPASAYIHVISALLRTSVCGILV